MYNDFHNLELSSDNLVYSNGNDVLSDYAMENVDLGYNFAILLVMIVVYQVLFYLCLKFRNKVTK